ncbi:hypothetical protein BJ878DRAFT_545873 [Calycina marina]|uniref:Uncharacterized protein n=1 Tax=Calycina marina TaxID=1763456 RepID=A0A9P7YW25_9HELO|nr:hypothetical protein BJ878DRAFT_545873 [Calycina marina]
MSARRAYRSRPGYKPTQAPLFRSRSQYSPSEGELSNSDNASIHSISAASSEDNTVNNTENIFTDFKEPPLNIPRSWKGTPRHYDIWVNKLLDPEYVPPQETLVQAPALTPPESDIESPRKNIGWDSDMDFTGPSVNMSPMLKVTTRLSASESMGANGDEIRPPSQAYPYIRDYRIGEKDVSPEQLRQSTTGRRILSDTPVNYRAREEEDAPEIVPEQLRQSITGRRAAERARLAARIKELERIEELPRDEIIVSNQETQSKPAKSDPDPEDRITAVAKLFELHDNKLSRSASPKPKRREEPKPQLQDISVLPKPTPRVIGAYLDSPTPRPKKRNNSPLLSKEREKYPDSPHPKEIIINSAPPTTAAKEFLYLQDQIEDNTLDNFASSVAESSSDREIDTELSDTEKLKRFDYSMKKTTNSIRDARQGIERLEQAVSEATATSNKPQILLSAPAAREKFQRMIIQRNPNTGIVKVEIDLSIPVPKLWMANDAAGARRNWKFTWLGFTFAALLTWSMAEFATCAKFCHPTYASSNDWSFDDPFFPWAIPTKLDQWTGRVISSAFDGFWEPDYGCAANEWWLGRDRPVGIVMPYDTDTNDSYGFHNDELV